MEDIPRIYRRKLLRVTFILDLPYLICAPQLTVVVVVWLYQLFPKRYHCFWVPGSESSEDPSDFWFQSFYPFLDVSCDGGIVSDGNSKIYKKVFFIDDVSIVCFVEGLVLD